MKTKIINISEYDCHDDGTYGKSVERTLTRKMRHKSQNRTDLYHSKIKYEIKTGSSELEFNKNGVLRNAKKIIYIPVVQVEINGDIIAERQEGFILDNSTFVNILENLGLVRYKKRSDGSYTYSIQTIWNRKQNKPHSKKKFEMLVDALYNNCECTLEEFLQN